MVIIKCYPMTKKITIMLEEGFIDQFSQVAYNLGKKNTSNP